MPRYSVFEASLCRLLLVTPEMGSRLPGKNQGQKPLTTLVWIQGSARACPSSVLSAQFQPMRSLKQRRCSLAIAFFLRYRRTKAARNEYSVLNESKNG